MLYPLDHNTKIRHSRRHLCACGRPARFYSHARKTWRWAPDHPLCRQCWQSQFDSLRNA